MQRNRQGGWQTGDPRNDRTYFAILVVLVVSVMVGAAMALAGELVFDSPAMTDVGFGAALVCGAAYFVLRIIGRVRARQWQQARRPREDAQDHDDA